MGRKIDPNLFKQLSIFNTLQSNSKNFLVQKRFFHEIEVRWFLNQVFIQKGLDLQHICYEQSFSEGVLIRLEFISLNNLVFFPKKKDNLSRKLLSNFKSTFSPKQVFNQQKKSFKLLKNFLKLQGLISAIKPYNLIGISSIPFFLSNKKLKTFLRMLYRLLERYKSFKHFSSILLIGALSLTFPGFLNLFTTNLVKFFFKTRSHSVRLRFLRSLIALVFKNNRKISKVLGISVHLVGRLDKKPRTKLYKISLGKLKCQTTAGEASSKTLQAITKNGTFGLFVYFRFSI